MDITLDIKEAIAKVVDRHDLTGEEMTAAMRLIMTGGATPAQIAGFLIALRMKGETVTEITAAAAVMRELASTGGRERPGGCGGHRRQHPGPAIPGAGRDWS